MKILNGLLTVFALGVVIMGMIVLRTEISYASVLYCECNEQHPFNCVNCNHLEWYDCDTRCTMDVGPLKFVKPQYDCHGNALCTHPNPWCTC